jgi:hypothetical protein
LNIIALLKTGGVAMYQSKIDFYKISKALHVTLQTLDSEQFAKESAMEKVLNAKKEWQQALSFSSTLYK